MKAINEEDTIILDDIEESVREQFMDDITSLWLKYDKRRLMEPEAFATLLIHHGTSLLYHTYGPEAVVAIFSDIVQTMLEDYPEHH